MPTYSYKARAAGGKIVTGKIDADSEKMVAAKLRAQQLMLVSAAVEGKAVKGKLGKVKPSVKDMCIFSRQFGTMINAGVPILQSLAIIAGQMENRKLAAVIGQVHDDIGGGISLSEAMGKHPSVFSSLFVNMVKAGESGGVLDSVLDRLSVYLEKADALARKVKGALVYPAIVTVVALGVIIFLLVGVIPTFKTVFASFGAELPAPTRILLAVSETIQRYFFVGVIIIVAGLVGFRLWVGTPGGRRKWDAITLKIPLFGNLIRKNAVAKFCRTLGTLLKSGVSISEGLDIVARTVGNVILEEGILKIRHNVREGSNLADPMKEVGIFPNMVIQMVSVGEETGTLDDMLNKSANFYEDEVDSAVEALTSMIEPLLMVFMGVAIGAIVIAMFMPMFSMSSAASGAG